MLFKSVRSKTFYRPIFCVNTAATEYAASNTIVPEIIDVQELETGAADGKAWEGTQTTEVVSG